MLVSYCAVFPVDFFVWIIEGVMSAHFEYGYVASKGGSNVVHIDESYARLAYHERVGWRRDNAVCDVGLEVHYAGAGEVEVVAPSGHNWIRLDSFMSMLLEE